MPPTMTAAERHFYEVVLQEVKQLVVAASREMANEVKTELRKFRADLLQEVDERIRKAVEVVRTLQPDPNYPTTRVTQPTRMSPRLYGR